MHDVFDHVFVAPVDFDRACTFYRDISGTRRFVLSDPDDNLIAFEQPISRGT